MTMQEEFEAWYESLPPATYGAFRAWCAAYRAGQEEMRERAAKVAAGMCANAIRALPLDAVSKERRYTSVS